MFIATEITNRLENHRGAARVRILDADDVRRVVDTHGIALSWARANGLEDDAVETHAVGGVVANSYKQTPKADEFRIRGAKVVSAGRGYAKKAPHGDGPRAVVAVRVPAGTPAAEAAKTNPPEGARLHGGFLRWFVY